MGLSNLIVGDRALQNVSMNYFNVINYIITFVEPTPPTNIITNETIMIQYIITQGLKIFEKKGEAAVQK